MTDETLYHVYQADGYGKHYPTLIRETSESAAIEAHKDYWRDKFDKPADAEPCDGTYAKEVDPDADGVIEL